MHLLLFDIDGTLIASGGAGEKALRIALREQFAVEDDFRSIEIAGRTDSGIARRILERHQIPATEQNVSRFLEGYLAQLSLLLPQVPGRVLPGVVAMLDALRTRKDFAVGLLTGNLVRGAQLKLAHYGLWHHFPFGAFADDHHERNHLGPFAQSRAQAHHGIAFPPEKIWILGDTPHDIACARAIGARALAVATGIFSLDALEPHQPDLLLEDLSEGAALLDTLCSPSAR